MLYFFEEYISQSASDIHAQVTDVLLFAVETLGLILSLPLWLPLAVGASVVAVPVGVGAKATQYLKERKENEEFHIHKDKLLPKWSQEILESRYNKEAILENFERYHIREFIQELDNFERRKEQEMNEKENTIQLLYEEIGLVADTKDILCVFDFEFRKIREELKWYKAVYFDKTVPIVTISSEEITRESSLSLKQQNSSRYEDNGQTYSEHRIIDDRARKSNDRDDDQRNSIEIELLDASLTVCLKKIQQLRYINFFL